MGPRITEIYAFTAIDKEDDTEGIVTINDFGGITPLIGADIDRIQSIENITIHLGKKTDTEIRLKKDTGNIYGLIFGSKHPLGIEKFLTVAWSTNKLNGEANFDIDEDRKKRQLSIDPEKDKLTKKGYFKRQLREYILSKKEFTNKDILDFTLENGFIPHHAVEVLKQMRKEGTIAHFSHSKIGCKQIYTRKEIVTFRVINNEK